MTSENNTPASYQAFVRDPNYPAIEDKILAYWREKGVFAESVESKSKKEFVFYDGPPFANGLPHYGHLLTGYIKDAIPRYQAMKGAKVERRFGWDCHGLPAEMESERELGISGHKAITEYGIANFNEHCRSSVLRYTKDWETFVNRQARWVDFSNDYKTMDRSYMESVLWAFKSLWDKGLVYEGYRVMPYSWAVESPLSNFETRLDNSYRERQDPALTVRFTLVPEAGETVPVDILAWTTTPWTLPSNLALAIGPEVEYSILELDGRHLVLATAAVEKYKAELGDASLVGTKLGSDLVGRSYQPLFPFFSDTPAAFVVLAGGFVTTEDGTGVVHCAPGFGEEDYDLCTARGIPVLCPVDNRGCFTAEVPDYQGQQVFDANREIIRDLKARGVVLRHETYLHNYPHCWRTDTPLIFRAVSSWYVKVTAFRDRMVELNQEINWIPSHIRDGQFGKWLENARDWSISRTRFWGTPLPVWRSDNPQFPRTDVYGSLEELERDFGVKVEDLHRPGIDELVRVNPDDPSGKSMMRRVPEVFDCWFESGSMPFAQIHYPFENKEWFENHFPADFIVEYVAQTRGWFYTLMVLGTALFDRPPFKNCMCHGVVLDEHGKKLSKRLRNYPSPDEVFATHGADALRWFLISSTIVRGSDLLIDREGKGIAEVVRSVLNPFWNAAYFFTLYANTDGIVCDKELLHRVLAGEVAPEFNEGTTQVDRYLVAKIRNLVVSSDEAFARYDIPAACESIQQFLDVLTNWYIRRSRERFWESGLTPKKQSAYDTLYLALVTLCRVAAPVLPLLTEHLHMVLTSRKSVHLEDWPLVDRFPSELPLMSAMDLTRLVCSVGLSLREAHTLRTRLPLAKVIVAGKGAAQLDGFTSLIAEELNVKEVVLEESFEHFAEESLQVNSRALGPRLGTAMKGVLAAAKKGDWVRSADGNISVAGVELIPSEFSLRLVPKTAAVGDGAPKVAMTSLILNGVSLVVVLDIEVTVALEEEGVARDLVRHIQQARKDADLHVSDSIALGVAVATDIDIGIIERFRDYLAAQTLAVSVQVTRSDLQNEVPAAMSSQPLKSGSALVRTLADGERTIKFFFSR